MDCSFSETQFVFAILHELLDKKWSTKRGWLPPKFPTQRQERDLGYDVSIQGPVRALFFQFKVPEKKTTRISKYWEEYNTPYYVFKIWPDNLTHQHNNLIQLANAPGHNKVYYCAPAFITDEEFDKYYKNGTIANNSIFVPCEHLPEIEGADKHCITYTVLPRREYHMRSDAEFIVGLDYQGFSNDVNETKGYKDVWECFKSTIGIMKEIEIGENHNDILQTIEVMEASDNYEGARQIYDTISDSLMMKANTCFVILGDDKHDDTSSEK